MDRQTAAKSARRRFAPRLRAEIYSKKPLIGRRQYRARIVNVDNGKEQWMTSEGYNNKSDCRAAVEALEYMGSAAIIDMDLVAEEMGI